MKIAFLIASSLFLLACEVDRIDACGRACERANRGMVKYSPTEGCVCEEKVKAPDPQR